MCANIKKKLSNMIRKKEEKKEKKYIYLLKIYIYIYIFYSCFLKYKYHITLPSNELYWK